MIVYAFADFHAHIFTEHASPDETYINSRFRAQIETLEKLFEDARQEEEPVTILFAGDLFHKRLAVDVRVFNHIFDVIQREMKSIDHINKLYLLPGNHDQVSNERVPMSALEPFDSIPDVTVLSDHTPIGFGQELLLCPVPFSKDADYIRHQINSYADRKPHSYKYQILLGHFGVDGSKAGQSHHLLSDALQVGDLRVDEFDAILLGHFHHRQTLGGHDHVMYIGNTIQNTLNDEGQAKGYMRIELNEEKKEKPTFEFKEIPNKMFHTIREVDKNTQKLVDDGHYIRFIGTKEDIKHLSLQEDNENHHVRLEVQKEYKSESRLDTVDSTSTEADYVKAYVSKFYEDSEELESEALTVLKEALDQVE